MPTVYSILPDRFEDGRHNSILSGLQKIGYKVKVSRGPPKGKDDVLLTWTKHRGHKENAVNDFERAGGRAIICEESPLKGIAKVKMFSLCLHDHNGAGHWYVGSKDRWPSFGIEMKPWRSQFPLEAVHGHHILVAGQRGIGSVKMASPTNWHENAATAVRQYTRRPIKVRPHPKSRSGPLPTTTLDQDLKDAFAVVVWSSGVGTQALLEGIPVFYMAPHYFLADAADSNLTNVDAPSTPDRLPAFEKFAWSQWTVPEIESGKAFDCLLSVS